MSKIIIKEPKGPYLCALDTDAMTVTIREAYLGVGFLSDSGEKLSVSMRDSGFELQYGDKMISCQNGEIQIKEWIKSTKEQ